MEVEFRLDGDSEGSRSIRGSGFVYVEVTTVLMPPRTEKSPTTVMRRGWRAATRSSRIWFVTCS